MQKSILATAASFITVGMFGGQAHAAVLLYEGFNYTAPASLNGQTGGGSTGFAASSTWSDSDLDFGVTSGSLTSSASPFTSTGNKATSNTGRSGTNTTALRSVSGTSSAINFGQNGIYYISVLLNRSSQSASSDRRVDVGLNSGSSSIVSFGIATNFFVDANGIANAVAGTNTDGSTSFMVAKITTFAGTTTQDQIQASVFTSLPTAEPTSWGGTQSAGNLNSVIDGLRIHVGSTAAGSLDEIRIGQSFSDVTTVPEPTTMAALGGIGLAAMTRRRRTA